VEKNSIMKLVRLFCENFGMGRNEARKSIAKGEVRVNGVVERNHTRVVGYFDRVEAGDRILQDRRPRYILLYKPKGYVSATVDREHPTVIDLIDAPWAGELHLAGRLDRFTTGLVVLTNDGRFSEWLTLPEKKIPKTYVVGTDTDISKEMAQAFREGLFFAKEKIRTHPAEVVLLGNRNCRLTVFEGKHHQIKRMFARFDVKVTSLHRLSVGPFSLQDLAPGEWRELRAGELPDEKSKITDEFPTK
jgi:16S rRNA pseudouridine516 synthase